MGMEQEKETTIMANLLDYLSWRGDLTMENSPFCEVDGAILARIAYFPFDLIGIGSQNRITIGDAAAAFLNVPDIEEKVLFREDFPLMESLQDAPRFKNMEVFFYHNIFDNEFEVQFSAITIQMENRRFFVSFRGTDNTLVGWKENFNMGFECPVPAQILAVRYYDDLAKETEGRFILGGHSKGGNLAVYAGAFCGEEAQRRIDGIYNYDGPGFDGVIMNKDGYKNVCGRIRTLIPQSSVVGMLLEHEEEYTIVHSIQTGLMQHDVYSWELERNHFIYLEKVTDGSLFVDRTVKDWVAEMDYDRREQFIDAVYEVFRNTNARTLRDMSEAPVASMMSVLKSLKDMDESTRKLIFEVVAALMKSAGTVFGRWAKGEETSSLRDKTIHLEDEK